MKRRMVSGILLISPVFASAALADGIATTPSVTFTNSTSPTTGSVIPNLVDSYAALMQNNPAVMTQNIQTVITMTQGRTADQTLAAIHDDRTNQQYSVLNGLGSLTGFFMTGAGASASGTAPQSLTTTTYASATLQNYTNNINYLTGASWGATTFGNGAATPLAGAVSFVNNIVRGNSSTEPTKRTFERFMGSTSPVVNPASIVLPTISPLDARYANYSTTSNPTGLSTADTAKFVVPSYFSNFTVPAAYANTKQWVQGFTVTQAMVTANGGNPITVPDVGTFDAAGNFTPTLFGVGSYVPGIGTAPRPYRLSTAVDVPTPLWQIINNTNPYADGAFISGHTNSGYTQALGLAFLVPQQYQEMMTRAADLGNSRILAGMHSPLDVIGGRMVASAIAATNIYNALYDASGNRVDWTNPSNASAYSVYQAYTQTQAYLAQACGTTSVAVCLQQAQQSGATASDPYAPSTKNKATYTYQLTYGFTPIGPTNLPEVVPVQAQVLLLTRFIYMTDAQRTEVLRTTALPSGYPLLDGNTWDGWGRLNLYAAAGGYGSFDSAVSVTMDASQGGYSALDTWSNDIGGVGSFTKNGTGTLIFTGNNSYSGSTTVAGGTLEIDGSLASSPVTVASGATLRGTGTIGASVASSVAIQSGGTLFPGSVLNSTPSTININGKLTFDAGSQFLTRLVPGGQSDSVSANQVSLLGGTVAFVTATGTYLPGTRYTIVTAANGVSGAFSNVTTASGSSLPELLAANLNYDPTHVFLNLKSNFVSGAQTRNQLNVAGAIDAAGNAGGYNANGATLLTNLLLNTKASSAAAFDALSGEGVTGVQQTAFGASDLFMTTVMAQAMNPSDYQSQGRSAMSVGKSGPSAEPNGRMWASGFGAGASLSGEGQIGSASLATHTGGFAGGVDYNVTPDSTIGIAGGFSTSGFSVRDRATSGSLEGAHVGLYGVTNNGPLYVAGTVDYAHFSNKTTCFTGLGMNETSKAAFTSEAVSGRIEAGWKYSVAGTNVTPFVALQAANLWSWSFTETSTTPAAAPGISGLHFNAGSVTSVPSFLGLQLDNKVVLTDGMVFKPFVRIAWKHEFSPDRRSSASLIALPATFTVDGARAARDAARVNAGFNLDITRNMGMFARFDGEFSGRSASYAGTGGVQIRW